MCVGGWCAESYRAKSRSDERIALAWVGVNCTVRREKVLREYHQHRGGSNCTERREKQRENIISIGEDRIVPSEEKSIERIASASGRIELYRAKRKSIERIAYIRGKLKWRSGPQYTSIIVSFSVIYSMCTLVYQYNILMEYAYDAEITIRFHYASLC